jgi:hypothetical protein
VNVIQRIASQDSLMTNWNLSSGMTQNSRVCPSEKRVNTCELLEGEKYA